MKSSQTSKNKCLALAKAEGCTPTLEAVIARLIRFIETQNRDRGEIARAERSRLPGNFESVQVILDKLILILLGLDEAKHDYKRRRLTHML